MKFCKVASFAGLPFAAVPWNSLMMILEAGRLDARGIFVWIVVKFWYGGKPPEFRALSKAIITSQI
jgi:hypothetical protein